MSQILKCHRHVKFMDVPKCIKRCIFNKNPRCLVYLFLFKCNIFRFPHFNLTAMQGQIRPLNINLQPISSSVSKSFTTTKVTYTPSWHSANQENYDRFKHYKVVIVADGPIPHLGRHLTAKMDHFYICYSF